MKKIITGVFLFLCILPDLSSQQFGLSGDCQVNANNTAYHQAPRKEVIDATVKIVFVRIDGSRTSCSGILVNRYVDDSKLGFYILTANHCIRENSGWGDINVDFDAEHYIIFNYQIPNGISDSTKTSNRGNNYYQSESVIGERNEGYEYFHRSKLRLVNTKKWGDFALIEILTPVPPHFNVAYAGWNPSKHGNPPGQIAGVHHPRGDIKKISGVGDALVVPNSLSTGCYLVTTVIDMLFGWIWGRTTSTRTICKYVDIPYYTVPYFRFGVVEKGSSGAGLFDSHNNLSGILSGGVSRCSFPALEFYGAFYANYPNASIKNTLNPYHNNAVDLWGLDSRRITSYDNLILPGGDGTNGYYFPANHYQAENKIILRARNDIQTTHPITIFNGADYEFIAGNRITLREGFTVQNGASFCASIATPTNMKMKNKKSGLNELLLERLNNIILPPFSNPNISGDLKSYYSIFPNPATDILNISFSGNMADNERIEIASITGQIILNQTFSTPSTIINVHSLTSGIYILKIIGEDGAMDSNKIIVKR